MYDHRQSTFQENVPHSQNVDDYDLYQLVEKAAREQDKIEFVRILEGHNISTAWKLAQHQVYISSPGRIQNEQTWAKRLVRGLYCLTRDLWINRNNTLFKNNTSKTSMKHRKAIVHEVKLHLKIGFHMRRHKDKKLECAEYKLLKTWTTQQLETWTRRNRYVQSSCCGNAQEWMFSSNDLMRTT